MLESHSEWNDRFRRSAKIEQDEANDPARDLAKALLEKYKYAATDDLDHLLMAFVRGDALHVANLRTIYAAYTQESNKRAADRDLQTMWDTQYHGKLGDNSQELCDAIEHAVVPDLPYISPGELDVALRVLSTFGRKEKATELFEEFKRQRGHVFEGLSADSMPHGNYSYQQLKCYFSDIADAHKFDTRSLAEVMSSAFDEKFITSVDGARISEFTADNLVDYFMKNPQPKLTSKLRLLTQANDEPVRRMAYEAAEKIAATSSLDHMRMEGMGLLLKGPPADSNVGNA
jgi:hypothetical protein